MRDIPNGECGAEQGELHDPKCICSFAPNVAGRRPFFCTCDGRSSSNAMTIRPARSRTRRSVSGGLTRASAFLARRLPAWRPARRTPGASPGAGCHPTRGRQPTIASQIRIRCADIHHLPARPDAVLRFRRSRPGIPNVFRAPFQSDAAHQSNLMAPRVVSSRRPVAVIS